MPQAFRLVWILFILFVSSCSTDKIQNKNTSTPAAPPPVVIDPGTNEEILPAPTAQWIAKLSRLLRNGKEVEFDELETLLLLSRQEIVDRFINDPRFGDTVAAFNLFFVGRSDVSVRTNSGIYSQDLFALPHVLSSAKAVLKNEDYFRLFDINQPVMFGTSRKIDRDRFVTLDFDGKPEPIEGFNEMTREEQRQAHYEPIEHLFTHFLTEYSFEAEGFDRSEFCKEWSDSVYLYNTGILLSRAGFNEGISDFAFYWHEKIFQYCSRTNPNNDVDPRAELETHFARVKKIFNMGRELDRDRYDPQSILELKSYPIEEFQVSPWRFRFQPRFWRDFENSSTNMNRKRAAYFLSRFFCDDLTPIGFVEPGDHAKGKHGSDPACYSCHYKLDPMAGFFKTLGSGGRDYKDREDIHFDDGATAKLNEYVQNWATESGEREWNIGYIRSAVDDRLNSYGEDINDLLQILRTAPEVKACTVKRLTEYFLGLSTNIDAGYLAYLTETFSEKSKTSSGTAIKETIRKLALSNTLAQEDPSAKECYDYAPGVDPRFQPPCEVAYLLRKNCAACHNSSSPQSGLDLTSWIELENGEKSFPHQDIDLSQFSKADTFRAILARITSTDERFQMPPARHFPSEEREKIFLWINKYLEGQAR